jgi:hypothetical protein
VILVDDRLVRVRVASERIIVRRLRWKCVMRVGCAFVDELLGGT